MEWVNAKSRLMFGLNSLRLAFFSFLPVVSDIALDNRFSKIKTPFKKLCMVNKIEITKVRNKFFIKIAQKNLFLLNLFISVQPDFLNWVDH